MHLWFKSCAWKSLQTPRCAAHWGQHTNIQSAAAVGVQAHSFHGQERLNMSTLEQAPFWGRKKKEGNWRPSTGTTCSGTSGSNQRDQAKEQINIHAQFYLAKFRRSDWLKRIQKEDLINLVPLKVVSVPRAVLSFGVLFICLFLTLNTVNFLTKIRSAL